MNIIKKYFLIKSMEEKYFLLCRKHYCFGDENSKVNSAERFTSATVRKYVRRNPSLGVYLYSSLLTVSILSFFLLSLLYL
jgi:hypothetical protein